MADSPPDSSAAPKLPPPKAEVKRSAFLPPPKKASSTDKVVVTLSSVAKTPLMLRVPNVEVTPPPREVPVASNPEEPESIFPAKALTARQPSDTVSRSPQLNRTVQVKLPPKNGVLPKLTSLSGMSLASATPAKMKAPVVLETVKSDESAHTPPPLPPPLPKALAEEKPVTPRAPAFKLKALRMDEPNAEGSIFSGEPFTPSVQSLKPIEPIKPELKKVDEIVMARAPGLRDEPAAKSLGGLLPPPLPVEKVVAPVHAPPLLSEPPVERSDKMRLPPALRKSSAPTSDVSHPPALTEPDSPRSSQPPGLHAGDAAPTTVPALVQWVPANTQSGEQVLAPAAPLPTPDVFSSAKQPEVLSEKLPALSLVAAVPVAPSLKEEKPAASPQPGTDKALAEASLPLPVPPVIEAKAAAPGMPVAPSVQSGPSEPPPPSIKKPRELPTITGLFARKKKPVSLVAPPIVEPEKKPAGLAVRSTTLSRAKMAAGYAVPAAAAVAAAESAPASQEPSVTAAEPPDPPDAALPSDTPPPRGRAERTRKRRLMGTIAFYAIFLGLIVPALYLLGVDFGSETRVEGQVIPPPGTMLCNEVWIVSDFRDQAAGLADDLAKERAPKMQEIQERQDHVQRAQADIAAREERIRLLDEQIQAARDEVTSVIKQAHDAAQQVWDGPGAALENEYKARLNALQATIADRAKSLNLKYTPDPTYQSPEVWANAYRLALYQTPPGVDGVKEHQWIEDQIKVWRAYTKTFDDSKEKLRAQAQQIQLSPTDKVTDLNSKIEDLQHRVDSTQAEEDPLKTELAQAQADLALSQSGEGTLDEKYYPQLYRLPEPNIIKRLSLLENGRFSWLQVEKDSAFSQGDRSHSFWIFARAVRKDGRQYWMLRQFSITQNTVVPLLIAPSSFVSTKAILRPDLSADEQAQ